MTSETRLNVRTTVVGVGALVVGAALATWWLRPGATVPPPEPPTASASSTSSGPIELSLSTDAITRGGIRTALVEAGTPTPSRPFPGRVEANQYRSVDVTSFVPGRVMSVSASTGDEVGEGQVLADIYSPELSDAEARYLTMTSEFDAAHQRLLRTERLVEIGAASAQELERVRAEHTTHETDIETARARLRLLGMTNDDVAALRKGVDVKATVRLRAPRAGVVVSRNANTGLNVEASASLFRIVDLTSVWVIADVHERDLADVAVNIPASVTVSAFPGGPIQSRVAYIDPEVRPETRTTRVRVEVPNPGRRLRLGMYADVVIGGIPGRVKMIPRAAVQQIGDRRVVYVADPAVSGRFVERVIELGPADGERVVVTSGLELGEQVVAAGSFALRAERDRLGLGASVAETAAGPPPSDEHRIEVGSNGFAPSELAISAGRPARLTFVRTTDATCATEVVVPSLNLKRALPLNQPVTITIPAQKAGDIAFACGMNMFRGQVRVVER